MNKFLSWIIRNMLVKIRGAWVVIIPNECLDRFLTVAKEHKAFVLTQRSEANLYYLDYFTKCTVVSTCQQAVKIITHYQEQEPVVNSGTPTTN